MAGNAQGQRIDRDDRIIRKLRLHFLLEDLHRFLVLRVRQRQIDLVVRCETAKTLLDIAPDRIDHDGFGLCHSPRLREGIELFTLYLENRLQQIIQRIDHDIDAGVEFIRLQNIPDLTAALSLPRKRNGVMD